MNEPSAVFSVQRYLTVEKEKVLARGTGRGPTPQMSIREAPFIAQVVTSRTGRVCPVLFPLWGVIPW